MILVGSGGIWWDLVGSGGIWWDLEVESFDSTRSQILVGSVVESFDSTNLPKLPRVAVYRWKSVESTKFYCRAAPQATKTLEFGAWGVLPIKWGVCRAAVRLRAGGVRKCPGRGLFRYIEATGVLTRPP
jgi:hypothetical protein